ncbi:hypothetical protein J2W91_004850 [Paenibacillus amylolyticus]|uniref:Uncharacterized protein n=1 Tax=Paenibacillus amylolyticus TaxID=1451 RepID=A0AAP5H4T7_PAEAM|nr:hypothetical protein [Paenibacillus amylolyticus]
MLGQESKEAFHHTGSWRKIGTSIGKKFAHDIGRKSTAQV